MKKYTVLLMACALLGALTAPLNAHNYILTVPAKKQIVNIVGRGLCVCMGLKTLFPAKADVVDLKLRDLKDSFATNLTKVMNPTEQQIDAINFIKEGLKELDDEMPKIAKNKQKMRLIESAPWFLLAGFGHMGYFFDGVCCASWAMKSCIEYKKLKDKTNDVSTITQKIGWTAVGVTASVLCLAQFAIDVNAKKI